MNVATRSPPMPLRRIATYMMVDEITGGRVSMNTRFALVDKPSSAATDTFIPVLINAGKYLMTAVESIRAIATTARARSFLSVPSKSRHQFSTARIRSRGIPASATIASPPDNKVRKEECGLNTSSKNRCLRTSVMVRNICAISVRATVLCNCSRLTVLNCIFRART